MGYKYTTFCLIHRRNFWSVASFTEIGFLGSHPFIFYINLNLIETTFIESYEHQFCTLIVILACQQSIPMKLIKFFVNRYRSQSSINVVHHITETAALLSNAKNFTPPSSSHRFLIVRIFFSVIFVNCFINYTVHICCIT